MMTYVFSNLGMLHHTYFVPGPRPRYRFVSFLMRGSARRSITRIWAVAVLCIRLYVYLFIRFCAVLATSVQHLKPVLVGSTNDLSATLASRVTKVPTGNAGERSMVSAKCTDRPQI